MHHSYIYFCILDTVDTDDVKKTYPIFVCLLFSQVSFACTFTLLPKELVQLFTLLSSPRIKLYFHTNLKLTEVIKYFTLLFIFVVEVIIHTFECMSNRCLLHQQKSYLNFRTKPTKAI